MNKHLNHLKLALLITGTAFALSGCGAIDRVKNIGKAPGMSPTQQIVTTAPNDSFRSAPVTTTHESVAPSEVNSLWRTGNRTFFKDPRASRVGDILTVEINIADQAKVSDTTTRSRANSENAGLSAFPLGLGKATDLVNGASTSSNKGSGSVDRSESINLSIAAVVTRVLPNGNLVIQGHQEVRVNFELRDLQISGVVRPEDITATNTIPHNQIAEARISYGGRGQITDVQQPRYGQQLFDVLFPF
jgi:flagellar L-ring protein precursor FlgH